LITTNFGRQVYTCSPRTRVSHFGSPVSHTFGARGKNMQNFAYFHCERDASCHMTCLSVCLSHARQRRLVYSASSPTPQPGDNTIRHALPVLWITSCFFHITQRWQCRCGRPAAAVSRKFPSYLPGAPYCLTLSSCKTAANCAACRAISNRTNTLFLCFSSVQAYLLLFYNYFSETMKRMNQ